MLKVFSTNVVVSKGFNGALALKFFKDDNTNTRSVRFRIGKKVYDSRAENNARWLNYSVKAFNGLCDRIEKMNIEEGAYLNISGRLDEETWTDQNSGETKTAVVIILDEIEYAGIAKPKEGSANVQTAKANASAAPEAPAQNPTDSDNFTGFQNFGGSGGMFDEE